MAIASPCSPNNGILIEIPCIWTSPTQNSHPSPPLPSPPPAPSGFSSCTRAHTQRYYSRYRLRSTTTSYHFIPYTTHLLQPLLLPPPIERLQFASHHDSLSSISATAGLVSGVLERCVLVCWSAGLLLFWPRAGCWLSPIRPSFPSSSFHPIAAHLAFCHQGPRVLPPFLPFSLSSFLPRPPIGAPAVIRACPTIHRRARPPPPRLAQRPARKPSVTDHYLSLLTSLTPP